MLRLLVLLAVFLCAAPVAAEDRPHIVLVVLDDTRADGVDAMPVLQSRFPGQSVSFQNAFTPDPVCCPSRASILTGLYASHHGVLQIGGPPGGADVFRERRMDQQTLAVSLRDAGYRTGLFGKYLNAYEEATEGNKGPGGGFYVPPGWDRWWAFVSSEHYGGVYGQSYEVVEQDGSRTWHLDHSSDAQYSTDLSAERVVLRPLPACSNGRDDDGDGLADFPADPGCVTADARLEDPACDDDRDDDRDGGTDWDGGATGGPADPHCLWAWRPTEAADATRACGAGYELAGIVALLLWLQGRRRRAARASRPLLY